MNEDSSVVIKYIAQDSFFFKAGIKKKINKCPIISSSFVSHNACFI